MSGSYWTKVLDRRMTRRRAIAGTGALGAGAALLAACGGSDNKGSSGGGKGNLLYNGSEKDTTDQAKAGGTWKSSISRDPQNFDLYNFDPFSQPFANMVGTKFLYSQPSHLEPQTKVDIQGDLASSWEISPDKLTVTFKLNPAVKFSPFTGFHQGAPASIANRVIDADDVLFSWERFQKVSSNAGVFSNKSNPSAPVTKLEAPDKQTIKMTLNQPYSPLLAQLAFASVSYFYVLPKEGAGFADADFFFKWQFGGGPFMVDKFEPSVKLTMKKNPNFTSRDPKGRPFVDQIDMPVVSDISAVLAQFRAGNLFGGGIGAFGLSVEDAIQLKKDIPELNMLAFTDSDSTTEWFGMNQKGQWKDSRVRQAVQYSWDRDTYIDVFFSVDKLDANGIPSNKRWNTVIPCGDVGSYMFFPGYWMDPQDTKKFGENSKYFTLGSRDKDIAEGKRLLAAAGFPNGFEFEHLQYPIAPASQQRGQDIIEGMMKDVGIKATKQTKVTIPDIFGLIFGRGVGAQGQTFDRPLNTLDFPGDDVVSFLSAHFSPAGNLFGGWNPNEQGADPNNNTGDPQMNTMIKSALGEFDETKRVSIVQDFQRYAAKQFYYSRYPGGASNLILQWPAVENFNVFRGQQLDRIFFYEWINSEKRPLGSKTS